MTRSHTDTANTVRSTGVVSTPMGDGPLPATERSNTMAGPSKAGNTARTTKPAPTPQLDVSKLLGAVDSFGSKVDQLDKLASVDQFVKDWANGMRRWQPSVDSAKLALIGAFQTNRINVDEVVAAVQTVLDAANKVTPDTTALIAQLDSMRTSVELVGSIADADTRKSITDLLTRYDSIRAKSVPSAKSGTRAAKGTAAPRNGGTRQPAQITCGVCNTTLTSSRDLGTCKGFALQHYVKQHTTTEQNLRNDEGNPVISAKAFEAAGIGTVHADLDTAGNLATEGGTTDNEGRIGQAGTWTVKLLNVVNTGSTAPTAQAAQPEQSGQAAA